MRRTVMIEKEYLFKSNKQEKEVTEDKKTKKRNKKKVEPSMIIDEIVYVE